MLLYGDYQFICEIESDAMLPVYKGSVFRGIFGSALKNVVCTLKRQECETCLLKERCLYVQLFSQGLLTKRGVPVPPPPFVIEPPKMRETHLQKGASFDFNVLLFGAVNHALPYFVYAFDRMGKLGIGRRINGRRGTYALKQIKHHDRIIYEDSVLKSPEPLEVLNLKHPKQHAPVERMQLTIETPLRFKADNQFSDRLPFQLFMRVCLRRIMTLAAQYGDGPLVLDFKSLVKQAESVRTVAENLHWFDWNRYSGRQKTDMKMGGIMGSVTYAGDLEGFLPFINFCSKTHIGKQTTFGLGKIIAATI